MFFRKDIAHRAFKQAPASATKDIPLTYAAAGVSIDAGNLLVQRIKASVKSTIRPGSDAEIGGFGGAFVLSSAGYPQESPILIAAIDGVGTKLKIAQAIHKHDTVGIDLVAMSVNDLVVQGAEPLYFLDCYSTSRLDVPTAAAFVAGVAHGCKLANCALLGGETAEMPGMYNGDEYDAVGTATGAVRSRADLLPRMSDMIPGDVLLGLRADGFHSNGFSLVRKILEKAGLDFTDPAPWEQGKRSVGEALLDPTRIYVRSCLKAAGLGLLKGMAHITGGGLYENIPRVLPDSLGADIDVATWELQDVFRWFKKEGGIANEEFGRVWNTGVGMVLVVAAEKAAEVKKVLESEGETVYVMGKLFAKAKGVEGVVLRNLERWD